MSPCRTGNSREGQVRLHIHHIGHGVLDTASPRSLEQTMGGVHHTKAWQRVSRTTAGALSVPSSGTYWGQDLHMTLKFPQSGKQSLKPPGIAR